MLIKYVKVTYEYLIYITKYNKISLTNCKLHLLFLFIRMKLLSIVYLMEYLMVFPNYQRCRKQEIAEVQYV